jgi:hypothetical protein
VVTGLWPPLLLCAPCLPLPGACSITSTTLLIRSSSIKVRAVLNPLLLLPLLLGWHHAQCSRPPSGATTTTTSSPIDGLPVVVLVVAADN